MSRTLTAGADVAPAVITALVPVERPSTGRTGDLVGLPDTRGIRGSCLANLVGKLLLDKAGTPFPLRALLKLRLLPSVRIKPVPGGIYFFWGYRAIHTDEACDPDKVRATALFDDADPHSADRCKRKGGGWRRDAGCPQPPALPRSPTHSPSGPTRPRHRTSP